MQTVIDRTLLNYEVFGENDTKTILILHGWGRNIREWIPTAKILSRNYKVILLDLPGFGNSTKIPRKEADSYDYAYIIEKFLARLKLKNIILIGHSFGGKQAIILAARQKSIEKLILISPSGIEDKSIFIRIKTSIVSILKFLNIIAPNSIYKKIASLFASKDYLASGKLKESFIKIVNQNVISEAKKINVPTIIFWGDLDKELSIKWAIKLKTLISGSILRIVWGTSHSPHIEKPEIFHSMLTEYL